MAGATSGQVSEAPDAVPSVESSWFEGRWTFADENCDLPSNWTLIGGGNFVSEDLTGTWQWDGEKLVLNLVDLALDEETGEAGGRFQMEGPVMVVGSDQITLFVEPDIYILNRCPS
ncbi:hypothetical protein SAMN02745824_2110 [Parasphingorhabdus marina DSM 22363]|uniref:Protease inhibitor Inh n=1 Tax=Parasphingorhabdus marina DSM 22363 TaxID=1123272 RepID=A0A1N6EVE5_9SPHN|nr:hypothetical protein SAMN02745824_2110 [Parasphingorhabdus marina DSM 22363]